MLNLISLRYSWGTSSEFALVCLSKGLRKRTRVNKGAALDPQHAFLPDPYPEASGAWVRKPWQKNNGFSLGVTLSSFCHKTKTSGYLLRYQARCPYTELTVQLSGSELSSTLPVLTAECEDLRIKPCAPRFSMLFDPHVGLMKGAKTRVQRPALPR